ncbi:MAG: hypothetical protein HYZ54_08720 [Ignavibacteriae bacterium]|nr:hypothetical protein [Ignavibacteriota bacterium]
MKFLFAIVAILVISSASSYSQNIKATTQEGKEVILSPNGTWKYSDPNMIKTNSKPASSTKSVKSSVVKGFEFWMDGKKWITAKKKDTENAEFQFNHIDGNCSIMIFSDKSYVPADDYSQQFIDNLHTSSPDAKIVNEEKRIINGVDVRFVSVDAVFDKITFRYFICFYSGKKGTTQIISYTPKNIFPEFEKEIIDFMSGFVIKN